MFHNNRDNFKIAQAKGQTWDLLLFVYFISQKQCLRPLSCCAPLNNLDFPCQGDPVVLALDEELHDAGQRLRLRGAQDHEGAAGIRDP